MKDREAKTNDQLAFHKKGRKQRKKHDHRMVHGLVRSIARELAATYYENAAHDNAFYHFYPSQTFFIDYEWQRFVQHAKSTMVQMLDNSATPEAYKQDIYHALLLDASLPYSQQEVQLAN